MGDDVYERCFVCNDLTHRSGDDSIYIGVRRIGPWCESCHADVVQEIEGDTYADEWAVWASRLEEIRKALVAERAILDAEYSKACGPSGYFPVAYGARRALDALLAVTP